jgi:hypothetical protein
VTPAKRAAEALRRTAYHEAGHAIAALQLGLPFRYVTVVAKDDYLGCVLHRMRRSFRPDLEPPPRVLVELDNRIVCALSGVTAEAKLIGRMNHVGASSDYRMAADLALYRAGEGEIASKYLAWRLAVARARWENPATWATVEALAAALLERGKLTSKEARAVENAAFLAYARNR